LEQTETPEQLAKDFSQRFSPRDVGSVTILTFSGRLTHRDARVCGAGVRSIVDKGRRAFVCDVGGLDESVDMEERLGGLFRCCQNQLQRAGGTFCWLHGAPYLVLLKELGIMYPPPPNFETEQEAIDSLLGREECGPARPMVSMYVTAIAKLIEGAGSAEEVYARLRRRWYLSRSASSQPDRVLDLIREMQAAFPEQPEPGRELSREIVSALSAAGFLSVLGRTWGKRLRSRR
jgi:hypothetical protein